MTDKAPRAWPVRASSRVTTLRVGRGLSLRALAAAAALSPSQLHRIEAGVTVPTVLVAQRLAGVFEVPVERLGFKAA